MVKGRLDQVRPNTLGDGSRTGGGGAEEATAVLEDEPAPLLLKA